MITAVNRVVGRTAFFLLFVFGIAQVAAADTITISGAITQSTQDGTGPATNNPSLGLIVDGDGYSITLDFTGSISSPGTYALASPTLLFSDSSAPTTESSFDSVSVTVKANGVFDDVSLLGCLSSGSGCAVGNQLDINFEILAASLNMQNVPATGLDPPHPLDLLEDDGVTDIHGSVIEYSYRGTSAVPEPGSGWLLGLSLASVAAARRRRQQARKAKGGWRGSDQPLHARKDGPEPLQRCSVSQGNFATRIHSGQKP